SYALANLTKGRPFDLYGDARSRVYGGIDAESPAASASVDETKGRVVLYDARAVGKQLKLSTPIASLSVVTGASGRVKSIVASSADDATVTLTGNQVRQQLGLRS